MDGDIVVEMLEVPQAATRPLRSKNMEQAENTQQCKDGQGGSSRQKEPMQLQVQEDGTDSMVSDIEAEEGTITNKDNWHRLKDIFTI